jgi:hypothetical protein
MRKPNQQMLADHLECPSTVGDVLRNTGLLASGLVSNEGYQRVLEVGESLPACIARSGGFECELGRDAGAADVFLEVSRRNAAAFSASGGFKGVAARVTSASTLAAWTCFNRLAEAWGTDGELAETIPSLWLEFDVSRGLEVSAAPSLFWTLNVLPLEMSVGLTGKCLEIIGRVKPRALDIVAHLLAEGRSCWTVRTVGVMLSRAGAPIKLHLSVTDYRSLERVLDGIGCRHVWSEIAGWYRECGGEEFGAMHLSFDVDSDIGQRVGIEYTIYGSSPSSIGMYETFVGYLLKRGLCTPEERTAIMDVCRRPIFAWGSGNIPRAFRAISHFKVVAERGLAPVAKVYPMAFINDAVRTLQRVQFCSCDRRWQGCGN